MARPWVCLIVAATFMLLLSVPVLGAVRIRRTTDEGSKTGLSGIEHDPRRRSRRSDAFDVIVAKFPRAGQQSTARTSVIPGASTDAHDRSGDQDARSAPSRATRRSRHADAAADERRTDAYTLVAIPVTRARRPTPRARPAVEAVTRACGTSTSRRRSGPDSGVLVGGDTALSSRTSSTSPTRYTPHHHPAGARPVLHPADGRVPLDRRAREGDRDEPVVRSGRPTGSSS